MLDHDFKRVVATTLDEYQDAYGMLNPKLPIDNGFAWANEYEVYALVNGLLECGFIAEHWEELREYSDWDEWVVRPKEVPQKA